MTDGRPSKSLDSTRSGQDSEREHELQTFMHQDLECWTLSKCRT